MRYTTKVYLSLLQPVVLGIVLMYGVFELGIVFWKASLIWFLFGFLIWFIFVNEWAKEEADRQLKEEKQKGEN